MTDALMTFRFADIIGALYSLDGATHAEVYTFTLANPPDNAADLPKVKTTGKLVINGSIRLPAYQLTVQDGIEESGWSTATPDTLKIQGHLDPKFAGRLVA